MWRKYGSGTQQRTIVLCEFSTPGDDLLQPSELYRSYGGLYVAQAVVVSEGVVGLEGHLPGAMSHGIREARACAIDAINGAAAEGPLWRLLGFLDDDPSLHGQTVVGRPVLGPIEADVGSKLCFYVIGVASYRNRGVREQIAARLGNSDDRFATILHPSAHISTHASVGRGSVALQGSVVENQASVGKHVLVLPLSIVGHHTKLGDFTTLAERATICGAAVIGSNVYVGAGAIVRDGIQVGDGATVGMGAVATRSVPAGATVVGNPAKPMKGRSALAGTPAAKFGRT